MTNSLSGWASGRVRARILNIFDSSKQEDASDETMNLFRPDAEKKAELGQNDETEIDVTSIRAFRRDRWANRRYSAIFGPVSRHGVA